MHLSVECVRVDRLPIDVPEDETVVGLKWRIHDRTSITPDQQRIVFKGGILDDEARLQRCGVATGSVVYMVATRAVMENLRRSHSMAALGAPYETPEKSMSVGDLRFSSALREVTEDDFNLERQRAVDIRFNRTEMKIGGLRHIEKTYRELDSYWDKINRVDAFHQKTVIPERPSCPCTDSLPNPFGL